MVAMRIFGIFLTAVLLCGCAATKKRGTSFTDPYEAATIEQMVGNNVSGSVFARTLVCLNARRETRLVTTVTNHTVTVVTNVSLSYVTNLTTTITTNQMRTLATNEVAVVAPAGSDETTVPPSEAPQSAMAVAPPVGNTNVSVTTASNVTLSKAGNQTVATTSSQLQRSRQVTTTTNHLTLTTADNQNIYAETNVVVTVVTNIALNSVTNVAVLVTNLPVHDYYLCAEFTPPPDFALQSGESLVLLVDGVRHKLTQAASPSVVVPRRGFSAVLYRAAPQLLVDIANAKQVKIRLNGNSAVIEKEMSRSSRDNFKKFLVQYFKTNPWPRDHSWVEPPASRSETGS